MHLGESGWIWNDDGGEQRGAGLPTRWGVSAPTPEDWADMPSGDDHPMQETLDAVGDRYESRRKRSLTRAPYNPAGPTTTTRLRTA